MIPAVAGQSATTSDLALLIPELILVGASLVLLLIARRIRHAPVAGVAEALRSSDLDTFSVPEFKERFDLTRKWAIPILEYLDSSGVTRRVGDSRQIVRSGS